MPVATGYTCTDLKAIELGKEELHVLELKLKALIMNCIHFINVGQQLLAAGTRSTKSGSGRSSSGGSVHYTYTHVQMCACVNSLIITY